MNRLLVLFSLLAVLQSVAQTSEKYNSDYAGFYRAEELFEKEQYGAARKEFRLFADQYQQKNDPMYMKALYYEGVSALELYNNDGVTLLEDFNRNYPESIYKTRIYLKLGQYYYQKKEYKEAVEWLSKLRTYDIEEADKDEYYFKLGYANFQEARFPEARNAFYEVKDGVSQYASPSLYYYSHIAYQDQSYQAALEGFEKLLGDPRFKEVVPYYITQIYYLQGRYEDITRFAPDLVDSVKSTSVSSMNHLIGDAYYRVKKYDESVPYLESYNQKENTTRQEDYQLGYAYYKSSNFDKAIRMFDKVSQVKDSLGQIAFYHAGECYLKKGENAYARTAFEAAAVLDLDSRIQEDALYNYAVLSYKLDINPYDEAVEALELYLEKYPNSDRKSEVYQYLVNVYTSTNNYAAALTSLDKLPNKDLKLKTAYQIIAFNRGVELFQKANYEQSATAFELVEKYPIDAVISAKAKFWIADASFQLKNYSKAIQGYKNYLNLNGTYGTSLRADAYYNLGYAYFGQKDYPQAIESFRNFLQQTTGSKAKKADATMRLADCYYTTKDNTQAIRYYKEALELKGGNEDQALYYLARSYGFSSGGTDNKIKHLQDIVNNYPRSKYMLSAINETGLAYRFKNEDDKALRYFEQIVRDYPTSNLVKGSLIEIADIEFKKRNFAKSETIYKQVLDKYGAERETCVDAVKGLKEIYKAQKQPERINELVGKYACAEFSKDEEEEIYYESAMEPYMDSSFQESITELERYLAKFPGGKYEMEIKAYLGNSYYRTKNEVKAIEIYESLLQGATTDFTELAAIRVSKYMYNNAEYEKALPYYQLLEKVASKPEIVNNTRIGLMRCNFLLENWTDAADNAKKVLSNTQISNTIKLEAEFAKGISYYRLESYPEAKPSLEWVVKNTTTAFAAEAKFSLAEMYFKQADYTKSENEIRALLKMKPAYDFWIAKSLILQTRVLIAKNDLFQAEHTLSSVRDNYPDQEDGIMLEANQLWDELMQLKSKPKSVEEKKSTVIEINENKK